MTDMKSIFDNVSQALNEVYGSTHCDIHQENKQILASVYPENADHKKLHRQLSLVIQTGDEQNVSVIAGSPSLNEAAFEQAGKRLKYFNNITSSGLHLYSFEGTKDNFTKFFKAFAETTKIGPQQTPCTEKPEPATL